MYLSTNFLTLLLKKFIKKIVIFSFYIYWFNINSFAQSSNVKALQVDFFATSILGVNADGNTSLEREDRLLQYAQNNGYNYLLLLGMGEIFPICCTTTTAVPREAELSNFIYKAKHNYGIAAIGISGSALIGTPPDFSACDTSCISDVRNKIFVNADFYNARQNNDPERCIDVLSIEDEYWGRNNTSGNAYDYYSGPFKNILISVHNLVDSTTNHPLIAETYLARVWVLSKPPDPPNPPYPDITPQEQADFIDDNSDRIVLAIYFNGNWIQPTATSAFFEKDAYWGKRFELFNNVSPHDKTTEIVVLFSAEASSLSDNEFFGDYLNLIDNGYSFGTNQKYDNVYFNGARTEDKAFNEFMANYVRTDPYNFLSGPTLYNFPCGLDSATIESCTGYDATQRPNGNKIAGVMWFKYGLMPGADFYTFGDDVNIPINNQFTLNNKERITFQGAAALGETNPTNQSINSANLTNVSIQNHQWYYWDLASSGNYMFEPISGAVSQNYSDFALCLGCTSRYVHEGYILPRWNPYFFEYNIRNEMDVFGDAPIGFYNLIWFTELHKPGCANNNGSITVSGSTNCGSCNENNALVRWDNGSQYYSAGTSAVAMAYTINNLSAGTWHIEISYDQGLNWMGKTVTLDNLDNGPKPTIFCQNRFVNCDNQLSTTDQFASYQWYLNGNIIPGATQHTFNAINSGNYTIVVSDNNGCTGESNIFNLRIIPLANISGSTSTCLGNQTYSVPPNEDNTSYVWQVPNGATITQINNSILINWGSAYSTGGTITCTVTNACGISATSSIQVSPFLATVNSTYTCPGLSNGTVSISELTGGTAPYSYQWSSGTNTTSQLMTNLSAGTYTVTVTDINNCTATASTIVINFPSDLPAPIISGPPYAGAHLYTITNYNSAYDNYYSWNAIPNFGNVNISFPNNNKESANITWNVYGGRIELALGIPGCNQLTTFIVLPDPNYPDPQYYEERLSNPSVISSDLNESVDVINSFKLFPNPTTGKVSLNYNLLSTENGLIEITNILGVSLFYKKLNSESQHLEIDLSKLAPAIYYFNIIVDGKPMRQGMISIIR